MKQQEGMTAQQSETDSQIAEEREEGKGVNGDNGE